MNWISIMLSCNRRGLGISCLTNLNVALISKWIYRFCNERDSLWRRVVCNKSGMNPSRMMSITNRSIRKSSSINITGSMMDMKDQVFFIVLQCFRPLIRNGLNVNFWSNNWMGWSSLKKLFPRIFALVVDKTSPIVNFGTWEDRVLELKYGIEKKFFRLENSNLRGFQLGPSEVFLD